MLTELAPRREDGRTLRIDDATVNISQEKHIVRTQLVGLRGTIKEYICQGDYSVSLSVGIVAVRDGVIADEYPEQGIRQVRAFLDEDRAVEVSSTFFELFGISRLVCVALLALAGDLVEPSEDRRAGVLRRRLHDQVHRILNTFRTPFEPCSNSRLA